MSTYRHAIVKAPGSAYSAALTSVDIGNPDLDRTLRQHAAYVEALRALGIEVRELTTDDLPDSVFVEDTAICLENAAILTQPGAVSRRPEVKSVHEGLRSYYDTFIEIVGEGTVDGGDILEVGTHFFIGLSPRTNQEGAKQLAEALAKFGCTSTTTTFPEYLHLKSGVSHLGMDTLLVAPTFAELGAFDNFNKIVCPEGEGYAANAILVNGKVFIPAGFSGTQERLEDAGYECVVLDMSEYEKKDGGLSCLSLRIP